MKAIEIKCSFCGTPFSYSEDKIISICNCTIEWLIMISTEDISIRDIHKNKLLNKENKPKFSGTWF